MHYAEIARIERESAICIAPCGRGNIAEPMEISHLACCIYTPTTAFPMEFDEYFTLEFTDLPQRDLNKDRASIIIAVLIHFSIVLWAFEVEIFHPLLIRHQGQGFCKHLKATKPPSMLLITALVGPPLKRFPAALCVDNNMIRRVLSVKQTLTLARRG